MQNAPPMPPIDPYAPPQASLSGLTPSEQHRQTGGELRYASFWHRCGALVLDALILSPLYALDFYLEGQSRMYYVYTLAPMELVSVFIYLFMVVKYGGTPGKLLMGLRTVSLDGARVTSKQAALRYAPLWSMNMLVAVATISGALGMSEQTFQSLGFLERSEALEAQAPMVQVFTWLMFAYLFAALITMLANDKRRTLHDFLAGTVVVHK